MFAVALVLFVLAFVALTTGVLGLTGRLPRNRFVGVHTEAALYNDETFRIANRVAAPTSVVSGALLFTGSLVALVAGGFLALGVAVGTAVVALFTIGAGANAADRAVQTLVPAQQAGACGSSCGACSLRDACAPTS